MIRMLEFDSFSDALVDYSGFGKTLHDMHSRFSLLEFLDYCAILEGIVLYDHLIMVRSNENITKWDEYIEPLKREGILIDTKDFNHHTSINTANIPENRPVNVSRRVMFSTNGSFHITRSSHEDSWFEANRLVAAENSFKCSSLSLIRQRKYYENYTKSKVHHTLANLATKYSEFAKMLINIREDTQIAYDDYFLIPIPPIPLMILRKCLRFEDSLQLVLELRNQFSNLRNSLRSLRNDLKDDSISPAKKRILISKWRKSWETLSQVEKQVSFIELGNQISDIPDLSIVSNGINLNSLNGNIVLRWLLSFSANTFYKWRVRILHNIAHRYLATPDGDFQKVVSRLFGVTVTKEDMNQLEQWLNSNV